LKGLKFERKTLTGHPPYLVLFISKNRLHETGLQPSLTSDANGYNENPKKLVFSGEMPILENPSML
jgi:hypothetical protein